MNHFSDDNYNGIEELCLSNLDKLDMKKDLRENSWTTVAGIAIKRNQKPPELVVLTYSLFI